MSEEQISAAKTLSEAQGLDFDYVACPAEDVNFSAETFDCITACQCFFYFNHEILAEKLSIMLKNSGRLAVLYMGWLPLEDKIAEQSEKLVLQYNPSWTGFGDERKKTFIPQVYDNYFVRKAELVFDLDVPFTRESWNGRIKACRGIGASLSSEMVEAFSAEHLTLLKKIAPESFTIKHYAAICVLRKK